ncbi:hypothetical protein BATDEDRAFT_88835 [Batrachochytrium dendrobatidis JAM81]|uniref:Uncharacterized protein n=2 Tax=Batrachochytrium dendrobatidis TaxID=109871 RepID=F4P2V4_BATDJ|nr:uncharacterized protein BATDEDRAFT_88835 [Batrachochytrium dendrobatidis JAM81]EGF80343.1 hypothetical protein BATDEDRAFT_88835 [Batrachochytrium dendrobatidis JAM81]KAJ8326056.1 hypothetical protein O5D80_005422 [Batrachochytrium dendrobatidis]KAK5666521.1 hypothetical protein QVD99_006593 [Batrachochytrium dendrobatidis]OAJ41350.1 hypothetical protein BDEG_24971 [Batrachochytrium dendrobatidis JEL423]|eukprot:XP_006679252.1 hypothetical protein BATDEDRAFT_88835 [Batrachochytrium dendrobatidis JAM81]
MSIGRASLAKLPAISSTSSFGAVPSKYNGASSKLPHQSDKPTRIQQTHSQQQYLRDLFRMRYFRFKSKDIDKTIDFYTTFGMSVKYDGEQECVLAPVPPIAPQPIQHSTFGKARAMEMHVAHQIHAANGTNGLFGKQPAALRKNDIKHTFSNSALNDRDKNDDDEVDSRARVIILSYDAVALSHNKNDFDHADRIQLIFEDISTRKDSTLDSKYIPQSDITDRPVTQPKTDSFIPAHHGATHPRMETKVQHNYEYLVIYVHFIHRLVKRFSAKGYDIVLPPTELDSMKLCILKDPNGIEVRLYDMPDSLLNERNSKNPWFTRLGYYAIPTSYANDTALMYEALFQIRTPKSLVGKEVKERLDQITGRELDSDNATSQTRNLRKMGAVGTVRQAISKAQGFRLVDMDEFVVGLSNTVFYWLGNGLRTSACTLCLTEVSNSDTGLAITQFDPKKSQLIGIGFEVPNLDAVIHKLKYETKDQLKWSNVRHKMTGVGMVAKFKDRLNGLALELFCSKTGEAVLSKPHHEPAFAPGIKPIPKPAVGEIQFIGSANDSLTENTRTEYYDSIEKCRRVPVYVINHNHLRGQARIFSADAVCRIKQSTDYQSILPPTPPPQIIPQEPRKNTKFGLPADLKSETHKSGADYAHIGHGMSLAAGEVDVNDNHENRLADNHHSNSVNTQHYDDAAQPNDQAFADLNEPLDSPLNHVRPKIKTYDDHLRKIFVMRGKCGSAMF